MSLPPPPEAPEGPTALAQEELTLPGIEKVVPLRVIQARKDCPNGCASAANTVDYDSLVAAIASANEVFATAGIQFVLSSFERFHMPTFANLAPSSCGGGGSSDSFWSAVYPELVQVFPSTPSNAWSATAKVRPDLWWARAVTNYGREHEITLFVPQRFVCTGSGSGVTDLPNRGRVLFVGDDNLSNPLVLDRWLLTHELGHYFGLWHLPDPPGQQTLSNESDFDALRDPETGAVWQLWDIWDLVYGVDASGTPPYTYFNSRVDALAFATVSGTLKKIWYTHPPTNGFSACCANANNLTFDCDVGVEQGDVCTSQYCYQGLCNAYNTSAFEMRSGLDPALKGLNFSFTTNYSGQTAGSNQQQTQLRPETNAISASQGAIVRKFLRFDETLEPVFLDRLKPTNGTYTSISTHRTKLGGYTPRPPAHQLDFDGDGLRDVGYWQRPNNATGLGTAVVLLSSNGFSQAAGQFISHTIGRLGDVPVPTDLNGDGKTDLVFFRPGTAASNQATWHWCATSGLSCINQNPIAWGLRGDTPLVDIDFDGSPFTSEIAVYRPSLGRFAWLWPSTSAYGYRDGIGSYGSLPLPALYDDDFKTDLATHNLGGTFDIVRSQLNWNVATKTTVPGLGGFPPLIGMTHPRTVGVPYYPYYEVVPRRSVGVWVPSSPTNWMVTWDDPLNLSGGQVNQCFYGAPGDMPLVGLDRDGDFWTDYGMYNPKGDSSSTWSYFLTRTRSGGGCSGTDYNVPVAFHSGRDRVFAVADMTGDGKPEIMSLVQDFHQIRWFSSESNYTLVTYRDAGDRNLVLF